MLQFKHFLYFTCYLSKELILLQKIEKLMFFITSKLLSFAIKPITWILILLIFAIVLKTKRKNTLYHVLYIIPFY